MSEKGIFTESLDEMLELDGGLDVNTLLESVPALETDTKPTEEPEPETGKPVESTKKKSDISLKDINKVLDEQSTEAIKETKKEVAQEVDKDNEDKDDEASASLEQTTETSSDAPFTVIFARDLVEQGLLSSFDEEEFTKNSKELGDAEALRLLIKDEIDANIEAAKTDFEAGYQEYLSLIGKGVARDTAGSLLELKQRFDSIKADELSKEENVDLRKQVMTDYFKLTTSMPEKKIERLVQNSIDLGDDIDDSKEYLDTLKGLVTEQIDEEKQTAEKQRQLIEEENKRSIEVLKETINAFDEIIPGQPINKQTKVQMFEAITKAVQDGKGRTTNAIWAKRAEDPMFFDGRLAYLLTTGFFEKGKPWTKAGKAKLTKEVTKLEQAIERNKNTQGTVGGPVLRNPEQDKKIRDNIDSLRGIFGM